MGLFMKILFGLFCILSVALTMGAVMVIGNTGETNPAFIAGAFMPAVFMIILAFGVSKYITHSKTE
jgi:hypothetical protein